MQGLHTRVEHAGVAHAGVAHKGCAQGLCMQGLRAQGLHTQGWWGHSANQNFKGPSLFVLGYHWLHLATIDLVGDNREFKV